MTPEKYARILAELERLRVKVSRLELQPQSALPTPVVLEEAVDHAAENALLRAENQQLHVENARLQTVAASRLQFDSRARCEPGAVIVFPLLDGQRDVEVTVISCATRGGQSVTFKASAAFRGQEELIALKCISTSPGQQSLVWREVNVWRSAVHPSLQRLLGVLREDYENAGEHLLASPWMEDGNMLEFLRQRPDVSRLPLVTEVAEAVEYLHTILGIVHGDIKCENVLINQYGHAILTDFGLSTFVWKDDDEATTVTAFRGMFTVDFCAPELLHDEVSDGKRNRSKTTQTDVYAFGMLVLQTFALRRPWADVQVQNQLQLVLSISKGALPLRPDPQSDAVRYGFDDNVWSLCLRCWTYSPRSRPSMTHVASVCSKPRALLKEQLAEVNRLIAELDDVYRRVAQENARLAAENEHMMAKCREYGVVIPDDSPISLPSTFLPSPNEPTSSLPSTSDNDQGLLSVDVRPRSSSSSFPERSAPQNKKRRKSAPAARHPHLYAPRHLRAIAPSNPGGVGIDGVGHARTHSAPPLHITTAPPNNDNAYDAGPAAGNFTTVFSGASALSSPSSPNVFVSGPTDTSFAFGTPSSNFHFELPSPSSSSAYSTNSSSSFDTPSTPASYHYGPTTTVELLILHEVIMHISHNT